MICKKRNKKVHSNKKENKMEKKENLVKSIRFPKELKEKIDASAEKETRTFSAQVIHIIKKYYELQEQN